MNARDVLTAELAVILRVGFIVVVLHAIWTYGFGGPAITAWRIGAGLVVGIVLANGLYLFAKYRHPEWFLLVNGGPTEDETDA